MDPLDPAKNLDGSRHSKRRISSILKVTRKSSGTRESEQQENEVESAKPFEKRNSRRVSFAPATDVLLFAKDVKTASPTRNPLQELIAATAATTQNRVQMAAMNDGTQQIMGIENLLSAPLHGSQQSNMVSCDIPNDFGEKTVVFSTEDADMDMTCSHTINITGDAEMLRMQSHQDHDIFHTVGERSVVSDDVFADVSLSHTATTSSLPAVIFSGQNKESSLVTNIPFVNPDFENILASLSKSSGFSSIGRTPLTGSSSEDIKSKEQTAIDKENQIPKSLISSRNRSASCPEDECLGMAVAPGVVDEEDDPFQCLFPPQDMYTHSEKRSSQMTEKKPEEKCERSGSVEQNGSASFTKPRDLSGNPEIPRTRPVTAPFSKPTINTDGFPLQTPETKVDKKEWALDISKSCGVLFDGGLKSPEEDFSMDLTDVHTGNILEMMGSNDLFGFVSLSQGSNPAESTQAQEGVETSLKPSLKTQPQIHQVKPTTVQDYKEKTQRLSADDDCMDVTKSHTMKIDADVRLQLHQSVNLSPTTREQTLRLVADDTAMDMTQCLTEKAVSHLAPDSDSSVGKGEDKTCDPTLSRSLSSHCWKTGYKNLQINPVRAQMGSFASQSDGFTVYPEEDISMDVTQVQTGCILGGDVTMDVKDVQFLSQASHPKIELMTSQQQSKTDHRPSSWKETLMGISLKTTERLQAKFASEDPLREKTVRFTAADAGMDVTQSHTVNIIHDLPPHAVSNVDLPAHGVKMARMTTDDAAMNVTRSHTESISTELNKQSHQYVNLPPADGEKTVRFSTNDATMDVTQRLQAKFASEDPHREKTVRFTAADAGMDVTQSHTVNIIHDLPPQVFQNVDLPASGEKTVRFSTNDAAMDVTQSHTVNIITDGNAAPHGTMEKTTRLPAADAGMDVAQSHPVNIIHDLPPHAVSNVDLSATGVKMARLTKDDAAMDVTRSHTESISTELNKQSHQYVKLLPADGERTVRFSANDATMDVTQSHTVNIIHDLPPLSISKADLPANRVKMARLTTDNAAMDVTRSLKVSVSSHLNKPSHQYVHLPPDGEKTMRLPATDAGMDMTQSHTVNIIHDLPPHAVSNVDLPAHGVKMARMTTDNAAMNVTRSHTESISTELNKQSHQYVNLPPADGEKTVRFSTNDATMDVTQRLQAKFASEDPHREKTVRFTAADAGMDVTQSHTVNIIHDLPPQVFQNVDLPASGEKTVRFSTNDAAMDVTQSHTVNIITDGNAAPHGTIEKITRLPAADAGMDVAQSHPVNIIHDLPPHAVSNVDLSATGVKMARLTTDNAAMDVTRSHTESISTELNKQSHQYVNLLPADGEKTVRFSANDATMDVTRSHTANISTNLNTFSHQNVHQLPANGERTERLAPKRTLMGVTKSHTVNFYSTFKPKLYQNVELQPTSVDKTKWFTTEDACMDMTSCFTVNTASNLASETVSLDQNMKFPPAAEKTNSGDRAPLSKRSSSAQVEQKYKSSTTQEADATDTPLPQEPAASCHFQLQTQKADTDAVTESPSLVSDVVEKPVMETVTSCAETGVTDILHPDVFSAQDHRSDHSEKREFSGNNTFLGSSISEVEAFNPSKYFDSNKLETAEGPLRPSEAFPEKAEPSAEGPDVDTKRSRSSRRVSLADLRSKVRRLSNKIKAAADNVANDPGAAPVPPPDLDLDKTSSIKTVPLPVVQPKFETSFEMNTEAERPFAATPFNLKTQQLMSQLSVGGFKPKLPQRSNPGRSKRLASAGEATRTFSVTSRLSNLDDVGHINDEELGSCEDLSETLDISNAAKSFEKETSPKEEPEGFVSPIQGQKRPLEDEDEDERSLKACLEHVGMTCEPVVERDGNIAASRTTTQSISSSSSSHAALESTIGHSLFESQLEDYGDDGLGKLKDGTITVQEFFKLFKIDFVIHNPRQSILPGKLLSDLDATPLDLLKNRHISRPRQAVYEADVQILTAKVEGLKVRTKDLDKPLKVVNEHLWEETRHFSENELKSFGAKLKERNNFFRKLGKVKSHESKEELYSSLVRTSRERQQKVRGTIEEADKTIKCLDECICELEADILAVEEKGFGDKPGLKSLQEGLTKVSDAVADKERRISELELEKKQNSSKLEQMKAETSSLQTHIDILNMMNEWRLGERKNKSTCYTFLHNTMFLQLEYEQLEGNDADGGCEKKITNIAFKFELHPEKSEPHARLVHKLVSQYMEGQSGWVEKYSTSQDVPTLLHDVSLVVSRCRMLGEELRLLKMWGGLRFDILDISCMDTQVRVVFSSMKRCSKFEVVFDVGLTAQLCAFQVRSFKNVFGSSSIQQIEDIVASLASGRKLLTRIIKKIHETLLQ